MRQYFACSDIHSFYDEWMLALIAAKFDRNNPNHILIICGDLFDRGNQSSDCFDFVKQLQKENRLIYIRGNHEDLLLDCIYALQHAHNIHSVDITNGTVKTIANITKLTDYDVCFRTFDPTLFDKQIEPLVNFIENNSVDYFELGDAVFVHGWVPSTCDENRVMIVHDNWRDGGWKQARWDNGMEQFHFELIPPDKSTIVCGHWHTSFGWSYYAHEGSEFGEDAKFDPFIQYNKTHTSQIVALDACTAHTRKVNCVVFDETGKILY